MHIVAGAFAVIFFVWLIIQAMYPPSDVARPLKRKPKLPTMPADILSRYPRRWAGLNRH